MSKIITPPSDLTSFIGTDGPMFFIEQYSQWQLSYAQYYDALPQCMKQAIAHYQQSYIDYTWTATVFEITGGRIGGFLFGWDNFTGQFKMHRSGIAEDAYWVWHWNYGLIRCPCLAQVIAPAIESDPTSIAYHDGEYASLGDYANCDQSWVSIGTVSGGQTAAGFNNDIALWLSMRGYMSQQTLFNHQ